MANAKRLEELATIVENADRFDQENWHVCGSPQCVGGHAVARWGDFKKAMAYDNGDPKRVSGHSFTSQARRILRLTDDEANALFYDRWTNSRAEMADLLRTFARTGTLPELPESDHAA